MSTFVNTIDNQPAAATTAKPAAKSNAIWLVCCWVIVLLGAFGGLLYSHYQNDSLVPILNLMVGYLRAAAAALAAILPVSRRGDVPWLLGAAAVLVPATLLWWWAAWRRRRGALVALMLAVRDTVGTVSDASRTAQTTLADWRDQHDRQLTDINAAAQEVTGLAAAITRMNDAAQHSAERAGGQANAHARHAAALAERNIEASRATAVALQTSHADLQTAAKAAAPLADGLPRLRALATAIREAGEQTQVLALNAAINRAGRGLSVADEVRQLAERSAQQAAEISALLDALQSAAATADQLHAVAEQVASAATTAEAAAAAITEIDHASTELRDIIARTAADTVVGVAPAPDATERLGRLKITAIETAAGSNTLSADLATMQAATNQLARAAAVFRAVRR